MEKKKSPKAAEHTTIEQLRGNIVRLTADKGYLLKSKHTGRTFRTTITAHVAGYEVIEA